MPSSDVRNKKDILLQIPSPDMAQAWPDHLFPTWGDFGWHINTFTEWICSHFSRNLCVPGTYSDISRLFAIKTNTPAFSPANRVWKCQRRSLAMLHIIILTDFILWVEQFHDEAITRPWYIPQHCFWAHPCGPCPITIPRSSRREICKYWRTRRSQAPVEN